MQEDEVIDVMRQQGGRMPSVITLVSMRCLQAQQGIECH